MKTTNRMPSAECRMPNEGLGCSAGFPACPSSVAVLRRVDGFTGLSRPVFPLTGNWGLESPQNPQTGMSALRGTALRAPRSAFTLIELLTVIAVMGTLAALTLVVVGGIAKTKYRSIATAEMHQIENALEDYKAKYGVYPPSNANVGGITLPQLYYELSGVAINFSTGNFVTLDGSSQIQTNLVQTAFGVGGFINCSKGSGDDATPAKNYLPGLRANRFATVLDRGIWITNLVTSVNGPDAQYMPLGVVNVNPFRYMYPGTNNPNSYDLYVEIRISGQTNLICNWSKTVGLNTTLP